MKSKVLYEKQGHQWIILGRDAEKQDQVIDTNEYAIVSNGEVLLLDPGGIEIFPQVLAELTKHIQIESIKAIAASHQDPDIVSSLAMWLDLSPEIKVYCPWTWTGFIAHFGMGTELELIPIPDEGLEIPIGQSKNSVYAIPAHFCHSPGNFSFYDAKAGILFSGDIGAALLPNIDAAMVVEDFNTHVSYMKAFHERWMPSSEALKAWVKRVRKIKPTMICPQHGAVFQQDTIEPFLTWLESLNVGQWQGQFDDQSTQKPAWKRWGA
ncbi:MBL fold metallo-hydrolase [Deltaproteobacteria bacterium TL4]